MKARHRALEPIDRKYQESLQKLIDAYTKEGQLDAALAIRRELDRVATAALRSTHTSLPITGGLWLWDRGHHLTFSDDGTAMMGRPKAPLIRFTWEKTPGNRKIRLITTTAPDEGAVHEITFEPDFKSAEVIFRNRRWTIHRQ